MIQASSFFADTREQGAEEVFTSLYEKAGVKIERIDSHGQASPEGFWYDQPQDEWVLLIKGEAILDVEGQGKVRLKSGDHLTLPAHVRHRVSEVSEDAIWLAVHVGK